MNIYVPTPEEIPSGVCECGCGRSTPIVEKTVRRRRHFRGYPAPFLHGHGPRKHGAEHHLWKGGRIRTRYGYIKVYAPEHPQRDPKGYYFEHRMVMEQQLGRLLRRDEFVHHLNEVKDDNRPENLVVLSKADHNAEHAPLRVYGPEARRRMSAGGKRGAEARWGKKAG